MADIIMNENEWNEFTELAHRMRDAQISYFKTKTGIDLTLAKRLEKKFDILLGKLAPKAHRQQSIWTEKL